MNLKYGKNILEFTIYSYRGIRTLKCDLYLWNYNDKILISDLDGTISRSDLIGQLSYLWGGDWSHKNITKLSLQNIIDYNNNEMFKANQICQNIFYHQNEYFKNIFIRQQKIKAKHNNDKLKSNRALDQMSDDLKAENIIFQKYKNKVDRSEAYREKYNDMDKYYWRKYNVDNLMTKKYQKHKNLTETE